jgi:hypothetical protein
VDGEGNVVVADSDNDHIVLFQDTAVPAVPGLPERVRPLLVVSDCATQQQVLQDERVVTIERVLSHAGQAAAGRH